MIANKHVCTRTQKAKRIALLSVLGSTTGCQSLGQHDASTRPIQQPAVAKATATSDGQPQAPVQSVAYTEVEAESIAYGESEPSLNNDWVYDGSATIAAAAQPIYIDGPIAGVAQSAGMTLEQFESLALKNNPTIAELVATTQKAAGFRTQVSLRANPTVGYQAVQLADQGTDQHTFFISQTIVTSNKLALNRSVLNENLRAQLFHLEAQKYRVATDIRVKFYEALAAQRRVELIQDFQSVSDKAVELADLRKQAEEGSQLDVVQAKVLKNEIDLQLRQARVRFNATWRELAALAGTPQMTPAYLQGDLPQNVSPMDWNIVAADIVVSNPEYQAAQGRVTRARALICRHEAQPIPNLDV